MLQSQTVFMTMGNPIFHVFDFQRVSVQKKMDIGKLYAIMTTKKLQF